MTELVLGPLLRYVSDTEATVWVETSEACEVEVLGHREPTFRVEGHHYALVCIEGLEPASRYEYEVRLDGEVHWPQAGSDLPPSAIRTIDADKELDICFGSCRVAVPHEAPFTEPKDETEAGHEVDALWVLAKQMAEGDRDDWPEQLFLLGDQVYVDEGSPKTRKKIKERRGTDTPPFDEVTDFEEYTWLYNESWEEPLIRWLFANVSVSMLWDDHDMSDDWNISRGWLLEMQQKSWWHRRVVGCIASYWIYQHIGNLSPRELAENEIYQRVRGNQTGEEELFAWAHRIQAMGDGTRWSFYRDFGRTRAIFIDARAARVLEEGRRAIVDDEEWEWIVEHAEGDFDHLLVCTTIPWLLSPAFDRLEAWNEQLVESSAWGKLPAWVSEKIRREVDFDHWPAFGESFAQAARPPPRGRLRQARQGPGLGRRPLRRRPPRLPRRGRLPALGERRLGRARARLPGGLLALPQPARRKRAAGGALGLRQAALPRSPACWPERPARPTRGSAGAPSRAPTSTTRSRPWKSTAAAP